MGDGKTSLYDNGFYNIGVRPVQEDLGVGGTDPVGRSALLLAAVGPGRKADSFLVDPCTFDVPFPGQETVGCGGNAVPPGSI